jgi:hypothetical protein
MQEKHKVTLYLSSDLHRQLKIRSAVSAEPMSELAQKAIDFYLTHSDIVERVDEAHGRTHQIYSCPDCQTSVVIRDGDLVSLGGESKAILDEAMLVGDVVPDGIVAQRLLAATSGEEQLVPC